MSEATQLVPARTVVSLSPHPLMPQRDRELQYAVFLPKETIGEYLRRTGMAQRMGRQPFMLTINDRKLPRALWERCKPQPGSLIHIYAMVRDNGDDNGGGEKNPVAIVAMIALMYFTNGAVNADTMSPFAAAAVTVVGGMVINRMFPPPKPRLPGRDGSSGDSIYSLAGGSNAMRPNEPFSKIIGTHRVFPDFGARPYTEFRGDDQYAFYVFDLGYNDVDITDYKIGANSLSSYQGVVLEESGTDGKLQLFPTNVDTQEGAALLSGVWVQRTSSPNSTGISIELSGALYRVDAKGELINQAVVFQMEYRAVGAAGWTAVEFVSDVETTTYYQDFFVRFSKAFIDERAMADNMLPSDVAPPLTAGQVRIINAKRAPLQRMYRFAVPKGQYEVRVKRVSLDAIGDTVENSEIVWTQMRSYQPDDRDYTGRKRIALQIKSSGQLNGTLQQFSCVARAKTQVWNGAAWVLGQTSNPAWWYLDALRGTFSGTLRTWGAGLADDRIDIEGIKAFGAWCTAQGLTMNCVFAQQTSVQDVLNAISLMGRGTHSLSTGKHGAVWDAPSLPITGVFGMHNILAGTFEITYTNDQLAEMIEGTFINPDLDWQQDIVRAPVPGATGAARIKRIDLFGRTKASLAGEDVSLYAAANAYRIRRYKWQSDWEAMPCARGDVAELSHDLASLDHSGRFIEGGDATNLKLAKDVPLYPGGGAFIVIVKPDGTFASYPVAAGSGTTNTLTATPPLPFNPWTDASNVCYDYKWLYGPTSTPGKKVKIDSFKPVSERYVELTAVDENPAYYNAKANPVVFTNPKPGENLVLQLRNLRILEDGIRSGTGFITVVHVAWDATSIYSFADVRVSFNGRAPVVVATDVRERTCSFQAKDGDDVVVEVTAYGDEGRVGQSAKLTASKHIDFAAIAAPAKIPAFTISGNTVSWPESPEPDVLGYRIFFQYGNHPVREGAAPLHEGLITASPKEFPTLPSGTISIGIIAEDSAQLESEPTWIITELGDPDIANVLEEVDFKAAGFPGVYTGGAISGGNLLATDEALSVKLYAPDDAVPLYTLDSAGFYPPGTYSFMSYETAPFMPDLVLAGTQMTLAATVEGTPFTIEFRPADPSVMYTPTDTDPFYTVDGDPLYETVTEPYVSWPGSYTVKHDVYQFRVTTAHGGVQGKILELKAVIDAPDIEEEFNDFLVAAGGGTRLPLTKPFTTVKNIQLTLQGDGGTAVGARWVDKQVAPTGPLVEAYDGTLASVAGLLDARVKGW